MPESTHIELCGFVIEREAAARIAALKDSPDWRLYQRLLAEQAKSSEDLLLSPDADARAIDYHRGMMAGLRYFQQFVEEVAPREYAAATSRSKPATRGAGNTTP